jgi:hypothetical protein
MAYIETDDGYVNLATAQSVVRGAEREVIIDQSGESHGLPDDVSVDEELATILPECRGSVLHEITYVPAGSRVADEPPTYPPGRGGGTPPEGLATAADARPRDCDGLLGTRRH